ncbi:hypothetical protein ACMFMG_000241 [Clarireedia jacksonii]
MNPYLACECENTKRLNKRGNEGKPKELNNGKREHSFVGRTFLDLIYPYLYPYPYPYPYPQLQFPRTRKNTRNQVLLFHLSLSSFIPWPPIHPLLCESIYRQKLIARQQSRAEQSKAKQSNT